MSKKSIIIIALVIFFNLCVVSIVSGVKDHWILKAFDDALAPTINEGDIIICKRVNDPGKLRSGDIISYSAVSWSSDHVTRIGQIQEIYEYRDGLSFVVNNCTYSIHHNLIEGQFVVAINNRTIGIVIFLVLVLVAGIQFARHRKKKMAAAVAQECEPEFQEAYSQTGVPDSAELIRYKELLDMGVITQEEFDAKKKQLLGL